MSVVLMTTLFYKSIDITRRNLMLIILGVKRLKADKKVTNQTQVVKKVYKKFSRTGI